MWFRQDFFLIILTSFPGLNESQKLFQNDLKFTESKIDSEISFGCIFIALTPSLPFDIPGTVYIY